MDWLFVLAQAATEAPPEVTHPWWIDGPTTALGYEVPLRPLVGLPTLLVGLAIVAATLRWFLGHWLYRLAQKTQSTIDDAIAESLKHTIYPLALLVFAESVVSSTRLDESPVARKVLTIAAIVVVAWAVAKLILSVVDAWIEGRPELTPLGPPIRLGVKIIWVPLVLLTVLTAIHVEIIQFVTTLGVGSLAIALAMQDTLANVFSGVQLVLDQPIRAGDFIELDGGRRGIVHEIGLRSTKIRTLNNNMIIVPNSVLAKTMVLNNEVFDRRYAHRFFVGVGYDSDSRHVQRVLEEVLEQAGRDVKGVLAGPHSVRFVEFGQSALMFRLEVRLEQYHGRRGPLSEIHHRIHERLRDEGIEIPFPMRTVVLRNEEPAAPIAANS
jgi:small-conductance mechanosensitive channel